MDKAKIDVIAKLSTPKCVKDIRSFLRRTEFYCRFIKDFNKIARSLTNFLAKGMPFNFDNGCLNSWENFKEELIFVPIISAMDWSKPFEIMYDASNLAIGTISG